MKRFTTMLGVAVVAGAMYAAAALGGKAATPTAQQFAALKKEVAQLSAKVKTLQSTVSGQASTISSLNTTADDDHTFLATCLQAQGVAPLTEYGDGSGSGAYGYAYSNDGSTLFLTTGVDFTASGDTVDAYLQAVSPSCVSAGGALRHQGATLERKASLPRSGGH